MLGLNYDRPMGVKGMEDTIEKAWLLVKRMVVRSWVDRQSQAKGEMTSPLRHGDMAKENGGGCGDI